MYVYIATDIAIATDIDIDIDIEDQELPTAHVKGTVLKSDRGSFNSLRYSPCLRAIYWMLLGIYTYISIYICIFTFTYLCIFILIYLYIRISTYLYIYVSIYPYISMRVCRYMYVHIGQPADPHASRSLRGVHGSSLLYSGPESRVNYQKIKVV